MRTYNPSLWTRAARTALVEAGSMAEASLVGVVADLEESSADRENYPWIGEAQAMRLLKDELEIVGLSDAQYTLVNQTYAIGLEVNRDHLADDQLGGIMKRVRDMNVVALNFANKLIIDQIINATSLLAYDGVSFFNDAHPIRGSQTATQDNLLAGTGVTVAAIKTDIGTGIQTLMNWRAENNEPYYDGRQKFIAVIPPLLVQAFNEAIFSGLVSNTSNEAFRGMSVIPYCSARFTDINDWYLFDVTLRRPLIYQQARPVGSEFLGPGSDYWVTKEAALFKTSWRGVPGYKHPGLGVKFVN